MSTKLMRPHEKDLRAYSVLVDYWDDESGDTHELLGYRELLHHSLDRLTRPERMTLHAVDDKVLDLVAKNPETSGWDIEMLRDTAKLIELERTQPVLRVA
jgi:hypothetical protein